MATVITSECINCGACEPECPNTAIYQGAVEWELNGVNHPAVAQDIFYIVPEKCTECVGFHDHEACAAVCPVDCCVPDPQIPETEAVLIARAQELHPGETFAADFPSRFKKEGAVTAVVEAAPAPAPAAPPAAVLAAAAAAAKAPVAAAPPPAAAPVVAKATAPAGARVEKPLAAPKAAPLSAPAVPRKDKTFPGELPGSFDAALAQLNVRRQGTSMRLKAFALLAQPLLGALPYSQKKAIEDAVGDPRVFTAAGATGMNVLHNMVLYPAVLAALGALMMDRTVFSQQLNGLIIMGVGLASLEAIIRMREGVLHALPLDQVIYRGTLYGPLVATLFLPLTRTMRRTSEQAGVPIDGFHDATFEDKMERRRRYGEVFSLQELPHGYLLTVEFPRQVPRSALKDELGIPDAMPDYDYDLALRDGFFVVKAHVTDTNLRKLAAVSPAFPPDFMTSVELSRPATAFKHRLRGKDLEVALLTQ